MIGQQASKYGKAEFNGRVEHGKHPAELILFVIRIIAVWIFNGSADSICKIGISMSISL
jgi:hypothetical protein